MQSLLNSRVTVMSGFVERKKRMCCVNILIIEIYHVNFSKCQRHHIVNYLYNLLCEPNINEWTGVLSIYSATLFYVTKIASRYHSFPLTATLMSQSSWRSIVLRPAGEYIFHIYIAHKETSSLSGWIFIVPHLLWHRVEPPQLCRL